MIHIERRSISFPKYLHVGITSAVQRTTRVDARKHGSRGMGETKSPLLITVQSDLSDVWRLDPVIELLQQGQVGIIPTDTVPALVCDLENRDAVQTLYELKGASPTKMLSIIVRDMSDISMYTMGFPILSDSNGDFYRIAKRILPGPYTLILNASKALPKQITDFDNAKKKKKKRSTVGIRLPDSPVCAAILSQLPRPLLCTSAVSTTIEGSPVPPLLPADLADIYMDGALSFVVCCEPEDPWLPSTVLDLTTADIEVVREGKGDITQL